MQIYPTKGNVVIEELFHPGFPEEVAGIIIVRDEKKGIERPQSNLGIVTALGEGVEKLRIGDKVWYNRVDTWPYKADKKNYQIGKAKFLLAKQL